MHGKHSKAESRKFCCLHLVWGLSPGWLWVKVNMHKKEVNAFNLVVKTSFILFFFRLVILAYFSLNFKENFSINRKERWVKTFASCYKRNILFMWKLCICLTHNTLQISFVLLILQTLKFTDRWFSILKTISYSSSSIVIRLFNVCSHF